MNHLTYPLAIDSPLDIHFNGETKTLTLTCYQPLSNGEGIKMTLNLTPQATQEIFRAVEYLQKAYDINSEQLATPHNVQ